MSASEYYRGSGGRSFPGFPGIGVGPSPWVPSHVRNNAATRQQDFLQQCRGGGGGNNSFSMAAAPASFRNVFSGVASSGGHSSLASVAASMIPAGVTFTSSVDVGMGRRGGDMTTFANLSLCSQTESWTTSASYSSGESGRNLGLSSAYSGSGDNASMLRAAHALTGAGIMQLTDRRTDRLSMVGIIEGAGHVLSKIPAAIRLTKDLGRAILLAEDAREQAEEAAKKVADESTSAATGGDGEDPGSDDERDLLHNDLCNQEQMSQPGKITHTSSGQNGTDIFKNAENYAKDYGGDVADYVKKTSTSRTLANGEKCEVHWVENLKTGERYNFKTKFPKGL